MKLKYLLFLFIPLSSFSQDTLVLIQTQDGSKRIHVYSKTDTLDICLYPNGKVDTQTKAYPGDKEYVHYRYYQNGKKMWERHLKNTLPQGSSTFYNDRGEKLITINYNLGNPIDTIVHSLKETVVFGNYRYSSIVYGGMEREDGGSNVQESFGPVQLSNLVLVSYPKIPSKEKSKTYRSKTDADGNFLFVLERKRMDYGLFPSYYYPSTKIQFGNFYPQDDMSMSTSTNWNLSQNIQLEWNTSLILTNFSCSSVGYAP